MFGIAANTQVRYAQISDLVRVHPGRPAAHPTATGWDEELRARTAGVRLPRPGTPSHRFGRIHPYVSDHGHRDRLGME